MAKSQSQYLSWVVYVAFCFMTGTSWVRAEIAPAALDVLQKAIMSSGEALVSSGEFVYEVRSVGEIPTQSEIDDANKMVRRQLLEASNASSDPSTRKHLKKLAEAGEDFGPSLIANADVRIQFYFAFSGPAVGGDRYLERRAWNSSSKSFGDASFSLLRKYGAGRSDCIVLDQFASGKIGPIESVGGLQQAPHYLGRISGAILAAGPGFITSLTNLEVVKAMDFDGAEAVEIRCVLKESAVPGLSRIDYLVVPSLGYIVPSVQEFDGSGNIVYSCQCEGFFRDASSALLFPSKCTTTTVVEGRSRKEHCEFEPRNVRLNAGVVSSRFKIEFPVGADVLIVEEGTALTAHDRVDVGIDDIESLASNDAFHVFGQSPARIVKSDVPHSYSNWRVFIGSLLLLFLVLIVYNWRGLVRFTVLLGLIGCSIASQAGCRQEPHSSTDEVIWPVVDLGDVAYEQQSVPFKIGVSNTNPFESGISLEPSCSCITIRKSEVVLRPHSSEEIGASLSLLGKLGVFEARVLLRRSDSQLKSE